MADAKASAGSLPIVRTLVLIALFALATGRGALYPSWLRVDEAWGHLAIGRWILEHHAIPRTGVLSQYSNLPWIDTSWGFDALLAMAYKVFGLRCLALLGMILKLALTAVTFLLAGGRRKFWFAALITAGVQFIFLNFIAVPVNVSVVFFGAELLLLLRWRKAHDARLLYAMPVLFLLWCNIQIQFVLGLVVLALFVGAETLAARGENSSTHVRPLWLAAIASVVATVLNPYGIYLAPQILPTLYGSAAFKYFAELHPLGFRQPQDYLTLVLLMGAFLVLGRRRSKDLFAFALLALFACVGFRIQRDFWLVVIASVAVLGDAVASDEASESIPAPQRWEIPALATAAIALIVVFLPISAGQDRLLQIASDFLPVRACDYVRAQNLRGPLFNSMEWGGFLRWYLPEQPVAMDGRANLYGDDMVKEYLSTYYGGRRLESAPLFSEAQTIVIAKDSALRRALTSFPDLTERYQEVYGDNLSSVIVKK